jgi:NhaP-type Na+/H+ or K+/H+ antiporter
MKKENRRKYVFWREITFFITIIAFALLASYLDWDSPLVFMYAIGLGLFWNRLYGKMILTLANLLEDKEDDRRNESE